MCRWRVLLEFWRWDLESIGINASSVKRQLEVDIGEVRRRIESIEMAGGELILETGWPKYLEHRIGIGVANLTSPEGEKGVMIFYEEVPTEGFATPQGDRLRRNAEVDMRVDQWLQRRRSNGVEIQAGRCTGTAQYRIADIRNGRRRYIDE